MKDKPKDSIEARLRERRKPKPSADFGRRMEELFHHPPPARRGWFLRPVALWQCVAACVLCVLCGYWFHGSQSRRSDEPTTTPMTVYVIQPAAPLVPDIYDATTRPHRFFDPPGEVRITYPAPENDENHV